MMSTEKENLRIDVSSSATSESASIPVISQSFSEGSSLQTINHEFNGKNFLLWSQSILLVIRGRGKMGYITREISRPKVEDQAYANWELNNP